MIYKAKADVSHMSELVPEKRREKIERGDWDVRRSSFKGRAVTSF